MQKKNTSTDKLRKLQLIGWIIWFSAAVFYGYEFIHKVSPHNMTSDLMQDFDINFVKKIFEFVVSHPPNNILNKQLWESLLVHPFF